ncbi:MAG: hypothetical protein Q9190_007377 [Brigantiaea leucoxantha]
MPDLNQSAIAIASLGLLVSVHRPETIDEFETVAKVLNESFETSAFNNTICYNMFSQLKSEFDESSLCACEDLEEGLRLIDVPLVEATEDTLYRSWQCIVALSERRPNIEGIDDERDPPSD